MLDYSLNPDRDWYEYPFGEIGGECVEEIEVVNMIGEEYCDPCDFPNNITKYIFGREGVNDEQPWDLLCQLDNGMFAYYHAWCDYTGFDCQGGMKLYVNPSIDVIVNKGMDKDVRKEYHTLQTLIQM